MKKTIACLVLFLFTTQLFAQNNLEEAIFLQKNKIESGTTPAETAIKLAKSFLDKPYVGGTLEVNSKEQLVCNLHQFDCFTFVENVLALTIAKEKKTSTYAAYQNILKNLRYRNGKIEGYGSRLHYFIDWARQAEKNGFVKNVTTEVGGEPIEKEINFMSKHRDLYPKLSDEKAYLEVLDAEKELNKEAFTYLPKAKIAKFEKNIKEGDILALTSNIGGLDVNHEGFAFFQNNRLYLLHASSEYKKVMISVEPLVDYLAKIKKDSGIMVYRIQ